MTIRDGVILLLVLVKKSAAKTHIYYIIIYRCCVLFKTRSRETGVRERERRVFVLFCSAPSLFFSTFFSRNFINVKFFSFPRKGEEKENFMIVISSFFLTHTRVYIIARARTHKKSSLKSASLPNKQSFAVVVVLSHRFSLSNTFLRFERR